MPMMQTRDGLAVAYYEYDFTDPWTTPGTILLLHAAMGSTRRWYRWIPRLARRYRVVAMDLRGHGHSEIPPADAPFSLELLVEDALRVLDLTDTARAHWVGNSAGGYVAQQAAIHHAGRVETLALFGSTPGLKRSQALTWIPRIQEIGLRTFLADTIEQRFDANAEPELVRWFIAQAGSNDPAFIARFVTHMCSHDFMDEIHRIACPTLIVAAGHEAIGHASTYDEMRGRIPRAQLVKYDTAAHNICDGYPDRCVDDLLAFLAREGGAGRQ